MTMARADHTATLLPSGQVLVAGGWNSSNFLASAELYNPATGRFSATGAMATNRVYHTATLLPSGQVLVAGGATSSDTFSTASAELYDPATGLFRATGAMATDRVYHTATLLPSRQVLVAGGDGAGGNSLASAELYTPPNLLTVGASTVGPASQTRLQRRR